MAIQSVEWRGGAVVLLDQRLLPMREVYRVYRDHREVIQAIKDMVVRGAPAVGVTAAMGIALAAQQNEFELPRSFERVCRAFVAARPTAVNLRWAVDRMRRAYARHRGRPAEILREILRQEAIAIHDEDVMANKALGAHGAKLIRKNATILTHCNTGALATAGYGTALGIVRAAQEMGRNVHVLATETRPYFQGARLTTWELKRERIPVTLIPDVAAGALIQRGEVDYVIVGADRVAANGDVANKIGTYTLAVVADRHGVPFHVAAPTSSIDLACKSGRDIPIEERPTREVTHVGDQQIAPSGVRVLNPAFDVTPHQLVTAIITENGVAEPPYGRSLARVVRGGQPSTSGKKRANSAR